MPVGETNGAIQDVPFQNDVGATQPPGGGCRLPEVVDVTHAVPFQYCPVAQLVDGLTNGAIQDVPFQNEVGATQPPGGGCGLPDGAGAGAGAGAVGHCPPAGM